MKTPPLVTVIMAVRHNEQYVGAAIQSVLNQSYTNLELIVISSFDSNKASVDIIDSFKDSRLKHFQASQSRTLLPMVINQGLSLAKGKYIARMDSDDMSLPKRLETEVAFMESRPDIAIAGAYAKTFGKKAGIFMKNPTKPEEIKANMLFRMSFVNPTVIMRSDALRQAGLLQYDERLKYCEDLDFFVRAAKKIKLANIPRILLHYRTHDTQATLQEKDFQADIRDSIFQRQLDEFGIPQGDKRRAVYRAIRTFFADKATAAFLSEAEKWFKDIAAINRNRRVYDQEALERVFGNEWLSMCRLAIKKMGIPAWHIFWRSEIRHWLKKEPHNLGRLVKFYCARLQHT